MQTAKPLFNLAKTPLWLVVPLFFSIQAQADGGYLRSAAPLDEHRGYCLDVAGFGANVRPDEPLRAHTCKYGEDNADQLFKWVDETSGHISMPAYNRCLAASEANPGASLSVVACANSDLQAWNFVPNGNLTLRSHPYLCVTFGEERIDVGSDALVFPGYGYRTSTLETCRARGDDLQNVRWGRDDELTREYAHGLRSGMAAEIAQGIVDIQATAAPNEVAPRTNALYENVPRGFRSSEVKTTMDLAYGEQEHQKLDLHIDLHRRTSSPMPVVIYFHGGGYTRGSKEASHNVGEYFASIGLVGVSATYGLAPQAQWPDGADDVGAAVTWVKNNIAEYGGDPEKIFVIGKSAGGGHVATYAFRPEVLTQEYAVPAGIILVSPSLNAETAAYFGADDASKATKQVSGNVTRASIPVLLTSAQYDPESMSAAILGLAYELTTEHGTMPRLRQMPGHNHYSSNLSIGTADRILSDEILDFVLQD